MNLEPQSHNEYKLPKLFDSRREIYNQIVISIQSTRLKFHQKKTAVLCHYNHSAAYPLYIISLVTNLQTRRHHTAGTEQQFNKRAVKSVGE